MRLTFRERSSERLLQGPLTKPPPSPPPQPIPSSVWEEEEEGEGELDKNFHWIDFHGKKVEGEKGNSRREEVFLLLLFPRMREDA